VLLATCLVVLDRRGLSWLGSSRVSRRLSTPCLVSRSCSVFNVRHALTTKE
jgi:hypothetical protein